MLLTIGSVLHLAPPKSVIWGTGVNFKLATMLPRQLGTMDIRAVRGPYSARAVTAYGGIAPAVFGDPALLLPRFMPELKGWNRRGDGGLLVVPNLNDFEAMSAAAIANKYNVLDPRGPITTVLRAIAESGFVVGSSLHAIVIADALGIPARFVASPSEGVFKYRDYLSGSGRPLERIAADLATAIELGGHAPADLDLEKLLASFPHDLWDENVHAPAADVFAERESIIHAWRDALTNRRIDEAAAIRNFIDVDFAELIIAGTALLDAIDSDSEAARRAAYEERFAEAHAHRLALAAGTTSSNMSDIDGMLLAALDGGDPSHLLRTLWLGREGAHAVVRAARSVAGRRIMALAIRPGTLSNNLATVTVVVQDSSGQQQEIALPVFEMYRRQWSIDLSLAFDVADGAVIESIVIRASDDDGYANDIQVCDLPVTQTALSRYPRVSSAPLWREQDIAPAFQSQDGAEIT
ncbi:polysaccharide pyruvyl transferase family protein [Microbacterium sp. NC79]|nr:polysaccharide pyruvyl transferase family protein [Microbacterium sp. NC79]